MKLKVPDISDYNNNSDLLFISLGILITDVIVLFFARYAPGIFGEALNIWYDKFGLAAVLSDVTIILIGFQITRYIYTRWIAPNISWSPLYFLALLVLVQAIHDILFYVGVIVPLPEGLNEMIDVFKAYSKGGAKIIGGDALLMISSFLITLFLKSQPTHITASTALVTLYTLPYILYNKH
jgi:hypothetical protein